MSHAHCKGIIWTLIPCNMAPRNYGQPVSIRGPCDRCNERRCRSHCQCGRTGAAAGRTAARPHAMMAMIALPKAKAAPKAKAKAAAKAAPAAPPPVHVPGPVGHPPNLALDVLSPTEWYTAMLACVMVACSVMIGSYQYDYGPLTDLLLRRLSRRDAFELVILVDGECYDSNHPLHSARGSSYCGARALPSYFVVVRPRRVPSMRRPWLLTVGPRSSAAPISHRSLFGTGSSASACAAPLSMTS